jgi:hypothetical protein
MMCWYEMGVERRKKGWEDIVAFPRSYRVIGFCLRVIIAGVVMDICLRAGCEGLTSSHVSSPFLLPRLNYFESTQGSVCILR